MGDVTKKPMPAEGATWYDLDDEDRRVIVESVETDADTFRGNHEPRLAALWRILAAHLRRPVLPPTVAHRDLKPENAHLPSDELERVVTLRPSARRHGHSRTWTARTTDSRGAIVLVEACDVPSALRGLAARLERRR